MEFSNRIVKSAAGSNYENGGWDAFVEYYRRLAAGGTEMIWVENFATSSALQERPQRQHR